MQGVPTYIIWSVDQVSTPQLPALVVEATGVADRDGRPYLASSSAFSMPGMPALGLLSPLGTHVEILLVLADERGAILGVARLRERNTRQGDSDDSQQALQGSVHDPLHCSIIEPRRIVR